MNYKFIGNCDINSLQKKLSEISQNEWEEHTFRQKTFEMFRYTQTLELMWDQNSLMSGEEGKLHKNYIKFEMDKFLIDVLPMIKNVYGDGSVKRVIMEKLPPKSYINQHLIVGPGLLNCKRVHIPIITNDGVIFTIDDEERNLKSGEMWCLNNTSVQAVINDGKTDRIHLIIDFLPKTEENV